MRVQVCGSRWVETNEVSKQKLAYFYTQKYRSCETDNHSHLFEHAMKTLLDGALHSTMLSPDLGGHGSTHLLSRAKRVRSRESDNFGQRKHGWGSATFCLFRMSVR